MTRAPRPWRLGVALGLLLGLSSGAAGQDRALDGDPFRGRELLSAKLCTQCHSVWGHGGQLAPDMSSAVARKSRFDLVGDFWNHTPRMMDAMAQRGHAWPTLDQGEMADLLSYLYYLRLFDRPGDLARGAIVYSQNKCSDCHTLGGRGGATGGPLDHFSAYPSSVVLAQSMWNAGPQMQRDQVGRGTAIPTFRAGDMADLQAHIRARGLRSDTHVELLPLPDPERGARVFRAKRCQVCHEPSGPGPRLASASRGRTVSEIGGILWNHSYAMADQMQAAGIPFPRFEGTDMPDLVSYLYFLSFVGPRGSSRRGAALFAEKGCAECHGESGDAAAATDLAESSVVANEAALSAAMWNHAPDMHALMAERAVAWPKFEAGEMEDLAAYLRRLGRGRSQGRR